MYLLDINCFRGSGWSYCIVMRTYTLSTIFIIAKQVQSRGCCSCCNLVSNCFSNCRCFLMHCFVMNLTNRSCWHRCRAVGNLPSDLAHWPCCSFELRNFELRQVRLRRCRYQNEFKKWAVSSNFCAFRIQFYSFLWVQALFNGGNHTGNNICS